MPCDAILFDLDGTLIDSLPDLAGAINLLRQQHQLPPLSLQQVRGYVGDGARALVQRALPVADFSPQALDDFLHIYQRHLCQHTAAYPGIPELLQQLPQALGVVTNKPIAMAEAVLEQLQLKTHFRVILGGDSCGAKKPAPDPLLEALRRMGFPPQRARMVGDHHTDLRAAHSAGIASVFCCWGYGNDGGEIPGHRVTRVAELHQLLLSA